MAQTRHASRRRPGLGQCCLSWCLRGLSLRLLFGRRVGVRATQNIHREQGEMRVHVQHGVQPATKGQRKHRSAWGMGRGEEGGKERAADDGEGVLQEQADGV